MVEFPFQISIKRQCPAGENETVICSNLLRVVAGTRAVYDAVWEGRAVIVKIFSHKINAKRHFKREWRGLVLLQKSGLDSPKPLFFGKTQDGHWAVVVEKISGSSTVLEVFDRTENIAAKFSLLHQVCQQMARLHEKGVVQSDLHLGNFLFTEKTIFIIDPAQVRLSARPIGKRKSISQIARLALYLPKEETGSAVRLCRQYAKARNWSFDKKDVALFEKLQMMHRKKAVRRGLKKYSRTNKRHLKIKQGGFVALFDRKFCHLTEGVELAEKIDTLMDKGQILKKGNTCYVSRIMWNGRDVVVKRYNHKNFIHSLRHSIKRSRARHVWKHAHHLLMLKVATPEPLAYIERCKGLIVWNSYLVTEYTEGQNLALLIRQGNLSEQQQSEIAHQVIAILDKLHKNRISHGDMKRSNVLITSSGPMLTDLDAMIEHKIGWLLRIRRRKDLNRFS